MKFTKPIKIYLFKEKNSVDVALRINTSTVITYTLTPELFEKLLQGWKTGIELEYDHANWYVQYKKTGPRPESKQSPYVRFSVSKSGIRLHFRVTYDDMIAVEREYFFQKNNTMYWDL